MAIGLKKQFLTYFFTALFEKGTVFFIAPIMVAMLSFGDFGKYALAKTIIVLCSIFISLGVDSFLQVEYIKNNNLWWKNYLINYGINFLIVSLIILSIPESIIHFTVLDKTLILFTSFSRSLFLLSLTYFRTSLRSTHFSKYRLSALILEILIMIVLFTNFKDWHVPVIASFISYTVFLFFFAYKHKLPVSNYTQKLQKKIYTYGLGIALHSSATWVISFSDQIIISKYLGTTELGIYSAILTIAMVSLLFSMTFNQFWTPVLFRKLKSKETKDHHFAKRVNICFIITVILASLLIYFIYPLIIQVLYPNKLGPDTIEIGVWIIGAYCLNGVYFLAANYINYELKSRLISIASLLAAITNIALNLYWVPKVGILGAAQATFYSFLIQSGLTYLFWLGMIIRNNKRLHHA